jgi:hypothetical protein
MQPFFFAGSHIIANSFGWVTGTPSVSYDQGALTVFWVGGTACALSGE